MSRQEQDQSQNYTISSEIYNSLHSRVCRATRNHDGLPVILKKLNGEHPSSEQISRFRSEYLMNALLKGNGFLKTYDFERHDKHFAIVFEDTQAHALSEDLSIAAISITNFLPLAIKITEIVAEIHHQGIIHKDINPSNILVNNNNQDVNLIDFGIASQLRSESPELLSPNILEGTLPYISPEQTGRMNRSVDYHTDLYSLGITFYEMLTGHAPFNSSDPMEMVHAHLAKIAQPLTRCVTGIPEVLSDIIAKLMEKTAEDRYQSCGGLIMDLKRCEQQLKQQHPSNFTLGEHDFSVHFQIPQKLYGRKIEIDTLLNCYHKTVNQQAQLLLISGYSGVGKSALVHELQKSLLHHDSIFIEGKFDHLKRNIPYAAVIQAFQKLIWQILCSEKSQLEHWKRKLLTALGDNGQIVIDVIPELMSIIGPQSPAVTLAVAESKNRFFHVFINFIQCFITTQQPLVLFFDDLQWADNATLKLIEFLITEQQPQALMIIGAYRNNEVYASHPVIKLNDDLIAQQVSLSNIVLQPLSKDYIQTLLAETLLQDYDNVATLASLCSLKTDGNPFFLEQLLYSLNENGCFYLKPKSACWHWNEQQFRQMQITQNVLDLIIQKIYKISPLARYIITLASCIGNQFDLSCLALIYGESEEKTSNDLIPLLQNGLIVLIHHNYKKISDSTISKNNQYRFLHDQVQQAAYSLQNEHEKQNTHRKIGKYKLSQLNHELESFKLFAIVDHLNRGRELINDEPQRIELIQLNLRAGKRAKRSAAYAPAFNYLHTANKLIQERDWQEQFTLTCDLYIEFAEAAYLHGEFSKMENLLSIFYQHCDDTLIQVRAFKIKILAYVARDQPLAAVECALPMLQTLGVKLPTNAGLNDFILGFLNTKRILLGKNITQLEHLPKMDDATAQAAMQILSIMMPAANLSVPKLMPLLILKMVNLSVKKGNCCFSPSAYSAYGMILCGVIGDIKTGFAFGKLAMNLMNKRTNNEAAASTIEIVAAAVWHWAADARETLAQSRLAYQIGIDSGSFDFAAYAAHAYVVTQLLVGEKLDQVSTEIEKYQHNVAKLKQDLPLVWLKSLRQTVECLRDPHKITGELSGSIYDETTALASQLEAKDHLGAYIYYFNKSMLCYFLGDNIAAFINNQKAQELSESAVGLLYGPSLNFYDSLIRIALFPSDNKDAQTQSKRQIKKNQKKLLHWSKFSEINFKHKWHLIQAELILMINNQHVIKATKHFKMSITLAQKNLHRHDEAVALERYAIMHLSNGDQELGQFYMRKAYYCYIVWGAYAKSNGLKRLYPDLKLNVQNFIAVDTISNNVLSNVESVVNQHTLKQSSASLDLASIIKASNAISKEIQFDKLLNNLIQLISENAGAERGILLLKNDKNWTIESCWQQQIQQRPLSKQYFSELPKKIIDYVIKNDESIVLDNAVENERFGQDSYIKNHQIKSILCAAINNQGNKIGIIYLENNLVTASFTQDRLTVVQLLSSQASISISNARLYSQQEQLVKERTQQLEQSHKKLLQSAHQTGMAEVAVNILHNAGNILNSLNTTLFCIKQNFNESELDALSDIVSVLDQHQDNLADFINNKKQGAYLFEYLSELAKSLKIEKTRYQNNIDKLSNQVSLITDIIGQQEDLLSQEKFEELIDLSELIEEVLQIINPSEKYPNTQLFKQIDEINHILISKHKLSTILINLITNALQSIDIKFKHSNNSSEKTKYGTLHIFLTHTNKSSIQFKINDNGIGISKTNISKIFQHGFTTKKSGHGFGLHSAANAAQELNGSLSVSSLGESQGASFILELPYRESLTKK